LGRAGKELGIKFHVHLNTCYALKNLTFCTTKYAFYYVADSVWILLYKSNEKIISMLALKLQEQYY